MTYAYLFQVAGLPNCTPEDGSGVPNLPIPTA